MPTNQQRREAAKRKLERQLVRRAQRERQRRQRLIVVGAIAAVLIIAGIILLITKQPSNNTASAANSPVSGASDASDASDASATAPTSSAAPATPCVYPTSGTAAKKAAAPTNLSPANTGTLAASITLNGQAVSITLNRKAAPCTVNSFVSLASQKYFDATTCHRETATSTLSVLQCGDPTATGSGTPGYSFADELTSIPGYSTTAAVATVSYKRGTLAMANSGGDTNGSQFFIVYKDSVLPPSYTVFGSLSDAGLKVVDAITASGVAGGGEDGKPATTVTVTSVTVPAAAVTATGSYASAASAAQTEDQGGSVVATVESPPAGSAPVASSPAVSTPEVSSATASPTATSPTGAASTGTRAATTDRSSPSIVASPPSSTLKVTSQARTTSSR